jgi:hypothetical protein
MGGAYGGAMAFILKRTRGYKPPLALLMTGENILFAGKLSKVKGTSAPCLTPTIPSFSSIISSVTAVTSG